MRTEDVLFSYFLFSFVGEALCVQLIIFVLFLFFFPIVVSTLSLILRF